MRLTIERRTYTIFLKQFEEGLFPGKRLGQAFHQEMALERIVSQRAQMDELYQLDGEAARKKIRELFFMN